MDGDYTAFEVYLDAVIGYDDLLYQLLHDHAVICVHDSTAFDVFCKRHNLPHINPHAFRHTMASMLYYNGMDSVSISKRLGHAQVSTTSDIYAHVIAEADKKNADILSAIFLKNA